MNPIDRGIITAMTALWARAREEEAGVTTVEWLGMAAVVVIVVAFLLPQVRSAAASMWRSIVGEMNGLFA